jgi:hypothetical protein
MFRLKFLFWHLRGGSEENFGNLRKVGALVEIQIRHILDKDRFCFEQF